MGVGVDSNVLIFERIKEELAAQRGVRAAINAGFSRVFLTLLDTHVASLISAMFLFQFGTGPIRGFALTLSIGLFVNLFTSIFVSKTLYEVEMSTRQNVATLSHLRFIAMHIFKNPNFDFVRWKWHAIALSWIVILVGVFVIWTKGMPKGVEFSGGTIVILKFDQTPDLDRIRGALPGGGANAVVQSYGAPAAHQALIRVHSAGAESGGSLSATAEAVIAELTTAGMGPIAQTCVPGKPGNCIAGREIVGPTVGKELRAARRARDRLRARRDPRLHRAAASASASRSARSSRPSTTC